MKNRVLTILKKLKEKGFFHIIGASTLNKIIGFASSWIIVRIISKAEYGVYTHAYNIYWFLILLNGLGIASAVLQIGSEMKEEHDKLRIYSYGLKIGLMADFLLAVAILIVGFFVPLKIQGSNRLLTMMAGLPLVTIITDLQLMYLRINLRNKQFSALSLINSTAVLSFSCALSFLLKAPGLVLAGYCSHLLTALVANHAYKVPLKVENVTITAPERKTIFSIALISMVNNGLSHLMYLLDVFVIGIMIADSEVIAAYKVATQIPTALQFIPTAVLLYVYPHFARNKDNGKWLISHYKRLIVPFGIFNALVSVVMFLFAEHIIKIVFGLQYLDAVIPFRILSVAYFFSATLRSISGSLLVTQRELRFNLIISVFSSIFNTVMNVIMIKAWASNGAAIATLLTGLLSGIISTTYLLTIFARKKRISSEKE